MKTRLPGTLVLAALLLVTAGGCTTVARPRAAARLDTRVVARNAETLYAEVRGRLRRVSERASPRRRATLIEEAVLLGERCIANWPGNAHCEYALALALGMKVREWPTYAHDLLPKVVGHLENAVKTDPALDRAGPERVLAMLLVRAPGWPAGPGDPETGLEVARSAASREPGYAPNWLAVAEAADATGDEASREQAAQKAAELAKQAAAAGERDAAEWQSEAARLLAR